MMKIPKILSNRYFYTGLAFLVWILFFDDNNMIYQAKLSSQLKQAKDQKQFYLDEISRDSAALKELMTNEETLEKFAREKYLMKKESEDLYVIVKK